MTRINVATLVKDEMSRFFPDALKAWSTFASDIIVLDDGSTDGSKEHAKEFGAFVVERSDAPLSAWGAETPARAALFEAAWKFTRYDDFILWLDADMVPAKDPSLFATPDVDAVAFVLYDMWNEREFREDAFWRGHLFPRLWMIRKRKGAEPSEGWKWSGRGIHSGHLPENFTYDSLLYAPKDYGLLHYAYVTPELREDKYARYASVSSDLTTFERDHAISIMDPSPSLVHLSFTPELRLPVPVPA